MQPSTFQFVQAHWVEFTLIGGTAYAVFGTMVGLVGTGLEAWGEATERPWLIKFGQRVEAVGADLPKLKRGSRFTAQDEQLEGILARRDEGARPSELLKRLDAVDGGSQPPTPPAA